MVKVVQLQTKLFLAFVVPSSVALVAVLNGAAVLNQLGKNNYELSKNNLPSVDGLWKINEGKTQIEAAENLLLQQSLTSANRELALKKIRSAWNQIDQGFEQSLNTPTNNWEEQRLQSQFQQDWDDWKRSHQNFLTQEQRFYYLNIPDPEQKRLQLLLQGKENSPEMQQVNAAATARKQMIAANLQKRPLFTRATVSLIALLQNNQEFANQLQRSTASQAQQAQVVSILSLITVPLIVGILSWALSRKIAQPIDQKINLLIKDLEGARDTLEEKVQERTQELQEVLQHLTNTQSQLVQAEKMSSLGQLVAGVAHEINNPVNFIHGNLTYLQEYTCNLMDMLQLYQQQSFHPTPEIQAKAQAIDLEFLQEDLPKILSSMKLGTDRIRQIVLSLRNFSRLDEAEFKSVDVHEGIDSTLLILQHRLKEMPDRPAIQVVKAYGNLPFIECYPGQLNQVFMNILANAIDALEELNAQRTFQEIKQHPNQITIRTSTSDEQWVKIAIADNALGIPESVKQQIFNPFFTTKPIGKGTGMGLAISHQIITEKHRGKLECLSTPGQGTEFVLHLPIRQQFQGEVS